MTARSELGTWSKLALALAGAVTGCALFWPLERVEGDGSETPAQGGKAEGGSTASGGSGADPGGAGAGGSSGASGEAGGAGTNTGGTGGAFECTTNADCPDDVVGPQRCRPSDRRCVPLQSVECMVTEGDASDPGAIFLGAFANYVPGNPAGGPTVLPLRLAIREINRAGGLPDPDGGHPLVLTICNNSSRDIIDRAMLHLTRDLEVPAVLAMLKSDDLLGVFEDYRSEEVLYLSPVGITSDLVDFDDDDLIWSVLGRPSDYANTYARLFELLEDFVLDVRAAPLRVALVVDRRDASNAELGDALEPILSFERGDAFDVFEARVEVPVADFVTQIWTFRPDIVVSAVGTAFTETGGILHELDQMADLGNEPFYVLSPYNAGSLSSVEGWLNSALSFDALANQRFLGVSVAPPADRELQIEYEAALAVEFGAQSEYDTGNYYDALYVLAYAAYAAGLDEPLTGPRVATGMRRLMGRLNAGSTPFNVGPAHIDYVFARLNTPESTVRLTGTLGPLDFEEGGYRLVNGSVFCYAVTTNNTAALRKNVLVYDEMDEILKLFPPYDTFPCGYALYP
jgi:hypothetical protein